MTTHTPGRSHKGQFERTIDTAERDAKAARLKVEGLSYQQIADRLGFTDRSTAAKAAKRALAEVVQEPAEELRKLELERLDDMYRRSYAVLEREHLTVSQGRVVCLENEAGEKVPLPDDGPVLAAVDRLLKIQDRRAKLLGLDAPTQVQATVTEVTQADLELTDLISEAKARNAVAEQALRESS